jgi:hypothetical protein
MKRAVAFALVFLVASAARAESTGTPDPTAGTTSGQVAPAEPETAAPKPEVAPPKPAVKLGPNGKPLPEVPDVGDEPLPSWTPPLKRPQAQYLSVNPEILKAQKLRQAGLWLASFGGAALLAGGIVYAKALNMNDDLGTGCQEMPGTAPICSGRFNPAQEDARDAMNAGAVTLLIGGAVLAGTGGVLFAVGQFQIRQWHRQHPADPLPALSGY